MLYTIPHYYNRFQCMAGSCPDTCCAGWEIAIDPKSLKKYRKAITTWFNLIINQ